MTLVKQTVLSEPPAPKEKDDVLFDFKDDDDENMEDSKEDDKEKNASAAQTVTPSKQQDDDDYDGMEEWERELRRQAL